MPVAPGTLLGPYEILSCLGAGGMGEVWKARDTRLDREVAIKISKEQFDERFEREARAVAMLNHPNICSLYDVGPNYLVMELVEGAPLAPPDTSRKLLDLAVQIADGLAAAHAAGIVHRDLKPGNILATRDGRVKILDFGLAKLAWQAASAAADVTRTISLTDPGTTVGTVAYMSPEQARGDAILTPQSDQFSLGLVLYELCAGKRAFSRPTKAETMTAIIREDPEPLPASVPAPLRWTIERLLAKDPADRYDSTRDLYRELRQMRERISESVSAQGVPKSRALRWKAAAVTLALASVLTLALMTGGGWFRARSVEPGIARFSIALPEGVSIAAGPYAPQLAISPDGRQLVVAAHEVGGAPLLWVRPLGSFSPKRLEKTEGAAFPFWSPDGQSIGFFADNKLKKIPASGGSSQTICDAGGGDGAAWGSDGQIVFSPERGNALQRVAAGGGTPSVATTLDKNRGEVSHSWPQFLPDGKHFLYFALSRDPAKTGIYVQEAGSKPRTLLLRNATRAAYAANYLLFSRDGALMAQRLDLKRFALQGDPIPVEEGIDANEGNGRAAFTVSESGVLAYRGSRLSVLRQMTWYDRKGRRLSTVGEPAVYWGMALSPDEKSVAVSRSDPTGSFNIWAIELASGIPKQLTFDSPGTDTSPIWSPDSQRIIFGRRAGLSEVVVASSLASPLYDGEIQPSPNTWSPDGLSLIYRNLNTRFVSVLPLLGERKPRRVLDTPFNKDGFRFSPDGLWIAYTSAESGRAEVEVASFPSFGDARRVSQNGGAAPKWSRDGKELFFMASNTLMSAEIRAGSKIEIGIPKPVFRYSASAFLDIPFGHPLYDVTGDGRKFLLNEALQGGMDPINVVLNWQMGLKK